MKKMNRILAFTLAVVLALSCFGSALAAEPTAPVKRTNTVESPRDSHKGPGIAQGFKSESFRKNNTYRYADDEIVRAILVMEGDAAAAVAPRGSRKAEAQCQVLARRHEDFRKTMEKEINFTLKYDFTSLFNGMSVDVAYGDLDRIAEMPGVETVYIANHYDAPVVTPSTANSGEMTGSHYMNNLDFNGDGLTIAVLDTGLRTTHEAFQPNSLMENPAMSEKDIVKAKRPGVYVSEKVPFAYDYGDKDTNVADSRDHGTHVSGIAAGFVETEDGLVTFSGAAPAAQIVAMKIFSDRQTGTSSDIYFAALEDAYLLDVDVINMSIGAQNGFTYDDSLETELYGNIYETLSEAGIVVCAAGGNEGSQADYASNWAGKGYVTADYADYGTAGTPSTYTPNNSVASVENLRFPAYVFSVNGQNFQFTDSSAPALEYGLWLTTFGGETLNYVMVPGVGTPEDLAEVDVSGSIAVIARGQISFEEKIENAANAGAVGVIVTNNEPGALNMQMQIETFEVPAVFTTLDAGQALAAAETKTLSVPADQQVIDNPKAWRISDFSSWGTTPELTLRPTITSVGGNVYSAFCGSDDAYESISGTSMASPNMAGGYASLLQALDVADKAQRAELARDLLESTAILLSDDSGLTYSPRRQGSGLGSPYNAYLNYIGLSTYLANPMVELGDDPAMTGVFTFDVELVNQGTTDKTFDTDAVVLRDTVVSNQYGDLYNSLHSEELDAEVTFSQEDITVPAGGSTTVTVTVTLSQEAKAQMQADFVNGGFVEGYIRFGTRDGEFTETCHATFMGFFGDWTKAQVVETYDFRDVAEADIFLATNKPQGSDLTYAELGFTYYDVLEMNTDFSFAVQFDSWSQEALVLAGDNMLDWADYHEEHISFSTPNNNADWAYCDSLAIQPAMLRNAKSITMTVTDKTTGQVYLEDTLDYLPKAAYDAQNGYWSNYSIFTWDGTDNNGDYVPTGTEATITFDAVLPYKDTVKDNIWSFDVTVDYLAPQITDYTYDKDTQILTVTARDETYLQAIYLADYNGNILDVQSFSSTQKAQTFTAEFDVSGLPQYDVVVGALDYATNETTEYNVPIKETGADATITFVTPAGETVVDVKVGDYFTFPECDEIYCGYRFDSWVDKAYEETDGKNLGFYYYPGDYEVIGGDMTVYALYAKGSWKNYEPTRWHYIEEINGPVEGDFAIIGYYLDYSSFNFDMYDTYLLDENGITRRAQNLGAKFYDSTNMYFDLNGEGFNWHFALLEDGTYSIQNNLTGKYLGCDMATVETDDVKFQMMDALTDNAKWLIEFDNTWEAVTLQLAADPSIYLLHDDANHITKLFDNDVVVDTGLWGKLNPADWYQVFIYRHLTEDFMLDYFTTEVTDGMPHSFGVWTHEGTYHCGDALVETRRCTQCREPQTREFAAGDCPSARFTDLDFDAFYHDSVDYMVLTGNMNGVNATSFAPQRSLSRGELVTMLWRYEGCPAASADMAYSDVEADSYYAEAIAWATEAGVVNGVGGNRFKPDAPVSREEAAAIFYRYAGFKGYDTSVRGDLSRFPDGDKVSDFAQDPMAWATGMGLIQGTPGANGSVLLAPTGSATRGQGATIFVRFVEAIAK